MSTVLNIAHRGFTRDYPDNTLEAFDAAIELPADGIECDVRETADGHFIMFHDPTIEGRDVSSLSLSEVKGIRLDGRFHIPTLEEALDLCRGRTLLNIEIKQVASLDAFLKLVRAKAAKDAVVLTSFNRDIVVELARRAPEIKRGVITAGRVENPVELAATTMSDIVVVRCPHADAALVEASHGAHRPVFVWGCTDMADVRTMLGLGVEGLITDFAEETAAEIARFEAEAA